MAERRPAPQLANEYNNFVTDSRVQQQQQTDVLVAQAYTSIIDEVIYDVALEVHRAVHTGVDKLEDVRQRLAIGNTVTQQAAVTPPLPPPVHSASLPPPVHKGNMIDVFGQVVPPIALDLVDCPSCGRRVAAGRFAPHLEKCMGRGRQASREANKRLSAMDLD